MPRSRWPTTFFAPAPAATVTWASSSGSEAVTRPCRPSRFEDSVPDSVPGISIDLLLADPRSPRWMTGTRADIPEHAWTSQQSFDRSPRPHNPISRNLGWASDFILLILLDSGSCLDITIIFRSITRSYKPIGHALRADRRFSPIRFDPSSEFSVFNIEPIR